MNICSTEDIRKKEIINLCDGSRLGCATDFEIDICQAKILALIVSSTGWFCFGKGGNTIIPWEKIECIGEDTILVKVEHLEGKAESLDRKKRKC